MQSDGQNATGKCAVGDGAVEQRVGRLQVLRHRRRRGLERHRVGRHAQAVAALHGPGHGDGNFPADRDLAEHGANGGALRDVVGRKFGEPGLRVRETFDQIRAAEGRDHRRLFCRQQLVHEGALVFRESDIALAVRNANEERGDGHVVGIGRRQLERADGRILRVRAQNFERIHARANFRLDRLSGIGIGVGGERDQENAKRLAWRRVARATAYRAAA